MREVDKKMGLTKQLARAIKDNRHQGYVEHSRFSAAVSRLVRGIQYPSRERDDDRGMSIFETDDHPRWPKDGNTTFTENS